ncbi:MAG: hypothetical protein WDO19_20700 [Bacteroidota bacterium]
MRRYIAAAEQKAGTDTTGSIAEFWLLGEIQGKHRKIEDIIVVIAYLSSIRFPDMPSQKGNQAD